MQLFVDHLCCFWSKVMERLIPECSNFRLAASEPTMAHAAHHETPACLPHTSDPKTLIHLSANSPPLNNIVFFYVNTHNFIIMVNNNITYEEPKPSRGRKRMHNPASSLSWTSCHIPIAVFPILTSQITFSFFTIQLYFIINYFLSLLAVCFHFLALKG